MSSSKRKLVGDKSSNDDKMKPSVFDRLGPGLSSKANESEIIHQVNLLVAAYSSRCIYQPHGARIEIDAWIYFAKF